MKYSIYFDQRMNYFKRMAKLRGLEFPEHTWVRLEQEIHTVYNDLYFESAIEDRVRALFTVEKLCQITSKKDSNDDES